MSTENNGGDDGDKVFTQDEVDRIVQDRLKRDRSSRPAEPADYKDLQAKAKKLDELEAANATDLERAQKEAADATARAEQAEAAAKAAAIRSSVVAAAAGSGAVDADAVYALLDKNALTVADDGTVTGVDDAVKTLMEAKPYLVGDKTQSGGGDAGGDGDKKKPDAGDGGPQGSEGSKPPQLSRADLAKMSPEDIVKADDAGQLADLYAGNT